MQVKSTWGAQIYTDSDPANQNKYTADIYVLQVRQLKFCQIIWHSGVTLAKTQWHCKLVTGI